MRHFLSPASILARLAASAAPTVRATDLPPREAEHGCQHRRCELAGVRVLTARMIRTDDGRAAGARDRAVAEDRPRPHDDAPRGEQAPGGIEADLAQADNCAQARQRSN